MSFVGDRDRDRDRGEPLPATMLAAIMYDVDDIRIEERRLPTLERGDVLVRTGASGVCSGDLMPWYVRRKAPFVFGHEPVGTIVAIGGDGGREGAGRRAVTLRDGTEVCVGDRVFAHHHAPCLDCDACREQRYVHCATWRSTALEPGGMAQYFRVPRANLVDTLALPDSVSFADGSLVEPLACVVKSIRRAFAVDLRSFAASSTSASASAALSTRPLAGRTLYVIGAGVMGLMHVALGVAFGATVIASDFNAARHAVAMRLGAAATFSPEHALEELRDVTQGGLADAVVCGPGSPAALAHAVEATGADGTMLMFTPIEPGERFAFDQSAAYFRDVRIVASYSCGPDDTRAALDFIARGIVTADRLEATTFAFPAVEAAYDAMRKADVVKAIVTF